MSQTSPEGIASAGIDSLSPLMTRRVCPLIGRKNKSFRDSSLPNTPLHQLTLDPRTPFNHYSCQEGERHEEKRRGKRRDRESIESTLMTSQSDHTH